MRFTKALVIIAAAALAAVSLAQPAGGGQGRRGGMFGMGQGSSAMLLMRHDVQDDLKLSDDQKAKLQTVQENMRDQMRQVFQDNQGDREAMQKAMQKLQDETKKQVDAILTADQAKRLKEINVQLSGNAVALNPEFQKDLGLTDDQIAKLKDLQTKQREAMQSIFEKMRNGEIERTEMPALMKKNQDAMTTEIDKVLTDAQKTKLKEMAGQPFTRVDDQQPGGPGGPGGGGN